MSIYLRTSLLILFIIFHLNFDEINNILIKGYIMKFEIDTTKLLGESNKANILGELLRAITFNQTDTTLGASGTFEVKPDFIQIPIGASSKVLVIQKDLGLSPTEYPSGMYFGSIGRGTFLYIAWINDSDTLLYFKITSLLSSITLVNDDAKKTNNWKIL